MKNCAHRAWELTAAYCSQKIGRLPNKHKGRRIMAAARTRTSSLGWLARFAGRAIIVASLFFLQGLPPVDASSGPGGALQYSVTSRYCSAQQQNESPEKGRPLHSQSCFLCAFAHDRGGLRSLDVPPFALPFERSSSRAFPQGALREPHNGAPGWTSAWSSRSPPTYS
jgi:hypothetical protein